MDYNEQILGICFVGVMAVLAAADKQISKTYKAETGRDIEEVIKDSPLMENLETFADSLSILKETNQRYKRATEKVAGMKI